MDFSWRNGKSVTQVIDENRQTLIDLGLIDSGPGYSDDELRAAEARIGKPIPPDVVEFFRAARPRQVGHDHWPPMGFFKIDDPDVCWSHLLNDRPHPIDIIWWKDTPVNDADVTAYANAEGRMLGGTPFFDRLFYLRGHATYPDGTLLLTDHESELYFVVAARSLAEYLSRLCLAGGIDLVSVPGEAESLTPDVLRACVLEFHELNPASEWAAQTLFKLDHPGGHPLGFHHWDDVNHKLVPIAQAGTVRSVTLSPSSDRELESIVSAGTVNHLMLVGGSLKSLDALARLKSLEELYIYNMEKIDAAPLNSLPNLKEVCFLRCHVSSVSSLAACNSLKRLRLNECTFDKNDLRQFEKLRPDVRME